MRSRLLKRVVDVVAWALGPAVLSPAILVVAAIVRLTMGKQVLFSQDRTGLSGLRRLKEHSAGS